MALTKNEIVIGGYYFDESVNTAVIAIEVSSDGNYVKVEDGEGNRTLTHISHLEELQIEE